LRLGYGAVLDLLSTDAVLRQLGGGVSAAAQDDEDSDRRHDVRVRQMCTDARANSSPFDGDSTPPASGGTLLSGQAARLVDLRQSALSAELGVDGAGFGDRLGVVLAA